MEDKDTKQFNDATGPVSQEAVVTPALNTNSSEVYSANNAASALSDSVYQEQASGVSSTQVLTLGERFKQEQAEKQEASGQAYSEQPSVETTSIQDKGVNEATQEKADTSSSQDSESAVDSDAALPNDLHTESFSLQTDHANDNANDQPELELTAVHEETPHQDSEISMQTGSLPDTNLALHGDHTTPFGNDESSLNLQGHTTDANQATLGFNPESKSTADSFVAEQVASDSSQTQQDGDINQTLSPDTEQTQAEMLKADLHNSEAFGLIDGSGTALSDDEHQDTNIVLHGNAASRGIAFGRIAFLHRHAPTSDRYTIDNADAELARFESVRVEAISQLSTLYEATVEKLGEQNAVVFQIHQMMLDDPEYVDAIRDLIRDEHVNAEYAVQTVGERFADMFRQMEDNDYMQGRAADVIDVSRRLTSLLTTQGQGFATKTVYHNTDNTEPVILATDDLAPSETVQLDQNLVHAILTSEGSSRSHTVIFARTLGLPAVINIGQRLTSELEGKFAIVDGGSGLVIINPDEKTKQQYIERKRTEDALRARLEQFRGKETRTITGRKINLYANIGAVSDVDLVKTSDAEGIGLFRSEYIYLSSNDYPSEETQFNIYKETLAGMGGKKVVIRTLDIGADKTADYFMLKHEENPAMGMRAVRICLTRPEIFKTQLRALYRASIYGTLAIMFPMITSVEEIKECKRLCKEVREELAAEGKPFSKNVELGIMIETPASAIISDILAEHVDFFSIGTNDLIQFTLAVDRQNAEVGRFLNPYHRAVIRLIEMTVNNAHKNGIWVGVCGELAADEGFTHELVRMGVDELSVVPSSILMLRARISTLG